MTKDPIVANINQTIDEVGDIMMEHRLQQLPVVEDGKLMGMVSYASLESI
ncbi:MAG: CBS domain-containing protein [Saprospiraceae bacterium]|nr:CBS domain-containing protein [Saprospiraceae bacterium]